MEYHSRPAEAHHCPDPLAHIRTVAVHRTLVAFGLGIPELAAVQPCEGIIQQFPALTTQLGATVVLPAPQLNHMPDRLLLPFYASHTLILFGDVEILDHLAGIANCHAATRDVLDNHTSGTDGDIAANGHTRKDGHGASYPDIVPDSHRLRPFPSGVPFLRVRAMAGSVNAHVRTDETVIAYSDRSFIKNREIEIRKEAFANGNIATVVAIEGLVDEGVPITPAKKPPDKFIPLLEHRRPQPVVLPNPVLGGIKFLEKERMCGIIDLAGDHIFPNLEIRSIPFIRFVYSQKKFLCP